MEWPAPDFQHIMTLMNLITELIFASSNPNKAREIQASLPGNFRILSLKEVGFYEEIPEPFDTLEENAKHKAVTVAKALSINCFAEDTGLETEALDGAPGVRTARYAGEKANNQQNIEKLLSELEGKMTRKARFKTVIALVLDGETYLFTGICEGVIAEATAGEAGFGYDPVFIPQGSDKTFAEMSLEEKNKYSHRKKAVAGMIDFLKSMQG